MTLIALWGKANPRAQGGPQSHPLVFHCLDVAAVAERLLHIYPAIHMDIVRACSAPQDCAQRLLVRLAGLHDIGKAIIGFQAKQAMLFPATYASASDPPPLGDHVLGGFHLLRDRRLAPSMRRLIDGFESADWTPLLIAVAAHHGRPLDASRRAPPLQQCEISAAAELVCVLESLTPGPAFSGAMDEALAARMAMRVAGLVNLADWIGSNQDAFPYTAPMDIGAYWRECAQPRAREALARAGLARAPASPRFSMEAFAHIETPSPLQAWARDVALPSGAPVLALLEDATGAGKTEAALILAHRLMAAGAAAGLYIALPTMATANAMYARLGAVYRNLFAPDARPSLALAHGAASLHPGFHTSVVDVGAVEPGYSAIDDETASAACAAWIADDRRRAFFAHVGVGTIDQAFLAVLPSKFAALRQLGLSGSLLVVDEAHAYDAYEREELSALLRIHAANGGSAIVMSATLPMAMRDALVRAFRQGCGTLAGRAPSGVKSLAYPLATLVAGERVDEERVKMRPDRCTRIEVERLGDEACAIARIVEAAQAGACAAWIRNTVDDCLDAAARLAEAGVAPLVYHARFAMSDRQAIEARVVATFGKNSDPGARAGKVLVATQVVEQSIDVDFDLLVSDLAPIDLLLQRAGRLWRHPKRARALAAPRMLIVSPDPEGAVDAAWLTRLFPRGAHVYPDHALLWLTAKTLFDAGAVRAPLDMRSFVEAVYAPAALERAPAALQARRLRADGEARAAASLARQNVLDFENPYAWSAGWSADAVTPTRLGAPRTVLRLARWEGGALLPWADVASPGGVRDVARAWALSEVSAPAWRIAGRAAADGTEEDAARRLEALEKGGGERFIVFPLAPRDGGDWEGRGRRERDGALVEVTYDRERGLRFP
jgi:CRISPR-associated endonuclease/helicase Cas3